MLYRYDSRVISYLKDYGSCYKLTICKGSYQPVGEWSDADVSWMMEQMHCNKRMAVKLLDLLHYDYEGFKRYVDAAFNGEQEEKDDLTERMGRYLNNVVRAKSVIEQLGACNPWQYFVTFTIDPQKFDRYDFSAFYKSFGKFVMHYRQRKGVKFDYIFVPEQHQDGAWHLHGLINGLPLEHLREFTLEEELPYYIRNKLLAGEKLYEWPDFADKFGYTIVEPLRASDRAASYITKYIGKGFTNDERFKGSRLFMPSHGLKRATLIKKGFTDMHSVKPIFENEYATTYKFSKTEYSLDDLDKFFL